MDGNEAEDDGALAAQTATTNEQEDFPGGIIGFSFISSITLRKSGVS